VRSLGLLLISCFLGSIAQAGKDVAAVVKIDDAHDQATGNEKAAIYEVPAADELILDGAGYTFKPAAQMAKSKIDTVMVATDAILKAAISSRWSGPRSST
jgi:hypothetical protein